MCGEAGDCDVIERFCTQAVNAQTVEHKFGSGSMPARSCECSTIFFLPTHQLLARNTYLIH